MNRIYLLSFLLRKWSECGLQPDANYIILCDSLLSHRVGKSIFAKLQLDTFLLSTITPVHNQVGNKKMYITTSTHFFSNKFFAILFCDD